MKKRIQCPIADCPATVEYEENPETARIVGATGCSMIEGEVDCEQECIRLINIKRAGQGERAAGD